MGQDRCFMARVPVRIYHIRGMPFITARGLRRGLLRWTEKLSCRFAHKVLCVSRSVRELAVAERICPPEKIEVLLSGGNGVDADRCFNPAHIEEGVRQRMRESHGIPCESLVIGFVGRVVRDKGLLELAEAWKVLREEFPSLHLLVVGPFEPQDPVPPDVERLLRGSDRIHSIGMVDDMPPCYAAMDVVALPSYREGLPNVALEAAAMGLPVVATRIPGCVDAVTDGGTGTLVPPHDAQALADAIRRYIEDPDLRHRHGLAGRERVLRDFRQEPMWEAVYREYTRLLRDKGLPTPELPPRDSEKACEKETMPVSSV